MTKEVMAVYAAILFTAIVAMAVTGWRRRISSQAGKFSQPLEALEYFGELIASANGFYVATTEAANHLERIAAYGLGIRGEAQILVFNEGLLIVRKGERPLALDKAQIDSVSTNQAVIDRVVEADGLITVNWTQDTFKLSTHLRAVDSTGRVALLEAISKITTREASK